ncbi:MAG: hypothetical protein IPN20_17335 [Haliscomenobacter sp.]|nr:hypothetical protein [Haliscomenobacter sp.]
MKTLFFTVAFFLLHLLALQGQSSSEFTRKAMDDAASDLFSQLRSNTSINSVSVMDFSMKGMPASELETYFTQFFAISLRKVSAGRFGIIDKDNLRERNPVSFNEVVTFVNNLYATEPSTNNASNTATTNSAAPKNRPAEKRFKGVDALVIGEVVELGNSYQLFFKAIENGKGAIVATTIGEVQKHPDLAELSKKRRQGIPGRDAGNTTFKHNNITWTLKGCRMEGTSIECELQLENEGAADVELHASAEGTRIISANAGHEFDASGVQLAERANSRGVSKTLVMKTPIRAAISFSNIQEPISRISKLEFKCWSYNNGNIVAEFRNIDLSN